jgi:hypothetical protein
LPPRGRTTFGALIPPAPPGTPVKPKQSVAERELKAAAVLLPLLALFGAVSTLVIFGLLVWLGLR